MPTPQRAAVLRFVSSALFIAISFVVATWVNRRLGLSYAGHGAIVFARNGKRNWMAIAPVAFSPLAATPRRPC